MYLTFLEDNTAFVSVRGTPIFCNLLSFHLARRHALPISLWHTSPSLHTLVSTLLPSPSFHLTNDNQLTQT
jgi:hypothetical protein